MQDASEFGDTCSAPLFFSPVHSLGYVLRWQERFIGIFWKFREPDFDSLSHWVQGTIVRFAYCAEKRGIALNTLGTRGSRRVLESKEAVATTRLLQHRKHQREFAVSTHIGSQPPFATDEIDECADHACDQYGSTNDRHQRQNVG